MKKAIVPIVAAIGLASFLVQANVGVTAPGNRTNAAIRAALKAPILLPNKGPAPQVSGAIIAAFREANDQEAAESAGPGPLNVVNPALGTAGCSNVFAAANGAPANTRANQDCGLRRQAEEQVGVNPTDSSNILVGQNDSRIGFNSQGLDFSIDGGAHFGDYQPGTRFLDCQGYGQDAFSDPAFAFDASGNLYFTAVGFDINSPVSGIYVWKSSANHKGSFLHSPTSELSANPVAINPTCTHPTDFNDKELMAADSFTGSPYKDSVYITWTIFEEHCGDAGDEYCSSPIYFTKSIDGGATWSAKKQISGSNSSICQFGNFFDPAQSASACNFDQGSYPVVSPNGNINVVFNNCNTPTLVCQQLFVKSTDGGTNWSAPVKVADDYDTQPFNLGNSNMTNAGCPAFRQCLLPNGYRMNDFPSMGINTTNGNLAVFWSDFRNGGPCKPDHDTGLPTEPCANHNNDVFASVSTDGGATWGATKQVTTDSSAQWQAWGDVGENGNLYVGYYDRKNNCESTGCNDITLAKSTNAGTSWTFQRITTGSMPNLTPANNPVQAGFLGDYMWTQVANGQVYLVWADTRGVVGSANTLPEEDVYIAHVNQ
jgi:hypothetical protein